MPRMCNHIPNFVVIYIFSSSFMVDGPCNISDYSVPSCFRCSAQLCHSPTVVYLTIEIRLVDTATGNSGVYAERSICGYERIPCDYQGVEAPQEKNLWSASYFRTSNIVALFI